VSLTRRSFTSALGAGWLALNGAAIAAAAHEARAKAAEANGAQAEAATKGAHTGAAMRVLTRSQARDVDAIASQIIPTDRDPGAHEAGAVYFIDHALAGFFSAHREDFQTGYADFASRVGQESKVPFADLPHDEQIRILHTVEETPFFLIVRYLTILGFLADPRYGGNRDGIGWRLVGFEDTHVFEPPFGYYDKDYAGFEPYAKAPAADPK
jgi:gluconate 2-dehydrogenase gamma chain